MLNDAHEVSHLGAYVHASDIHASGMGVSRPGLVLGSRAGQPRLSGHPAAPGLRGWSHLVASVAALPSSVVLVSRVDSVPALVTTALSAAALIGLFATSAAYHLLPWSRASRQLMRKVDHSFIYLFIAAAYTPFCVVAAQGRIRWFVVALVWIGALSGVAIKMIRFEQSRVLSATLYLVLGWLAIIMLPDLVRALNPAELSLLLSTGALYTAGSAVLGMRRPDPWPEVFGTTRCGMRPSSWPAAATSPRCGSW